MPHVINLCDDSTPEPDLPIQTTNKTYAPARPKPAAPSKPLIAASLQRKTENVYILSDSDDNDAIPPPKIAAKPSPTTKPRSSLTATAKASQYTNPSNTISDFGFQSDDFDSTRFYDDDPFASDPPPAKKPRLSPQPRSRVTRSPGFQKWVDSLQNSSNAGSSPNVGSGVTTSKRSTSAAGPSSNLVAPRINYHSSKNTGSGASSYKASTSTSTVGRSALSYEASASITTYGAASYTSTSTAAPRLPSNKRSISDVGPSKKPAAPRTSASGMSRSKTMGAALDLDPIVFTSSPDPRADARKRQKSGPPNRAKTLLEDLSDDSDVAPKPPKKNNGKGKATASGGRASGSGGMASGYGNARYDSDFESSDTALPDIGAIAPRAESSKTGKGKGTAKIKSMTVLEEWEAEKTKEKQQREKEEKAKGKSQQAKDKLAAKEAEKEEKRLAKEEKAREKDRAAEHAKVNVLMTDKKKSTLEMIVDLPSCLGLRLNEQIQTFLKSVDAEHTQYESEQPIVKWRRKTKSVFNEEAGEWDSVPLRIDPAKHIMCIMTAQEFVDLATTEEGRDMESHVLRLKAKFATDKIIYMIEGLEAWIRKNKNLQNRKYVQQVRDQLPAEETTMTSQKRKKNPEPKYVDEDLIEDALLKLQVIHKVLIQHTKVQIETAEWVIVFTQHISTIPYRAQKDKLDTEFCMEPGQVKSGDGPADTFTKMLQEMLRITPAIAYGIAAEYPTVQKLVKGLRKNGPLALQDCRKHNNKDGAFTDKRIGPSISKRVYNVFMSRDPGNEDV